MKFLRNFICQYAKITSEATLNWTRKIKVKTISISIIEVRPDISFIKYALMYRVIKKSVPPPGSRYDKSSYESSAVHFQTQTIKIQFGEFYNF